MSRIYHLDYDDRLVIAGQKWACVFPCSVCRDIDGHPQLADGGPVTDQMILVPQEPKYLLENYTRLRGTPDGLIVAKYFRCHDRSVMLFQNKQYLKVLIQENREHPDATYLSEEDMTWSDLEQLGEVSELETAVYNKLMSEYWHQMYAYENTMQAAACLSAHGHRLGNCRGCRSYHCLGLCCFCD